MSAGPCPDENALARLSEWELGAAESNALEAHVAACETCSETLAALALLKLPESEGSLPLPAGSVLGRYEVLEPVGAGGMGDVYRARDTVLGRDVGLKVLREHALATNAEVLDEAKHLAKFNHPNVVAVFDAGVERGKPFLAMEWVQGTTLQKWLAARPRSTSERWNVLLSAGEGLRAAHALGIVHRDFKPANVLVGDDGRVRVADFGLALLEDRSVAQRAGTPRYMAPEQRDHGQSSVHSDQFAFALVALEVLSARSGLDTAQALALVTRPVRRVLAQALEPRAENRHASMGVLLVRLRRARTGRRKRLASAAAFASAALALGLGLRPTCAERLTLDDAWDAKTETALKARFPERTWQQLHREAARYVRAWEDSRARICAAPSSGALGCLESRKRELRALSAALQSVPFKAAENARFSQLTPPRWCERPDAQASTALRSTGSLRETLAEAVAARAAGLPRDAAAKAEAAGRAANDAHAEAFALEAALEEGLAQSQLRDAAKAKAALRRAVTLAENQGDDFRRAQAMVALVWVAGGQEARYADAHLWEELAAPLLARLAPAEELEAQLANNLGWVLANEGRSQEALQAYRRALSLQSSDGAESATTWNNLALVQRDRGEAAAALASFEKAQALFSVALGEHQRETLLAGVNASVLRRELGDEGRTQADLEELRKQFALLDGPDAPTVARLDYECAGGWLQLKQPEKAKVALDHALSVLTASLGPDHPNTLRARGLLGRTLTLLGQYREAEKTLRAVLASREQQLGALHPQVVLGLIHLAELQLAEGRHEEAAATLEKAWTVHESPPQRKRTVGGRIRGLQADVEWARGRAALAQLRARQALELTASGTQSALYQEALSKLRRYGGDRR